MSYQTKEAKDTLNRTWGHDRPLDPMETMVINNAVEAAKEEYKMRQRHTLELIRQRASRADVPLEPKLFAHLQLQATNLFHNTLHISHASDADNINRDLDRLIASVLAVKAILAEEQVRAMMGG